MAVVGTWVQVENTKLFWPMLYSQCNCPLTHQCSQRPKQPDNFDDILQHKALLAKYLKEKC